MDKVILRLRIMNNKEVIEVVFDTRLSFKENVRLLSEITSIKNDIEIYDPNNKCFLDDKIRISEFNFSNFSELYIY